MPGQTGLVNEGGLAAVGERPGVVYYYDAFISYSRKDKQFAAELERALNSYKPPKDIPLPQRFLRVFRDEADLTGVEYHASIENHLKNAAKLIVICSPNARSSAYVNDEIVRFASLNHAKNIIPVLLAGVPNNDAAIHQENEKAFPDTLCALQKMPLATSDYRQRIELRKSNVKKGVFESAWYALLANLYDIERSDIEQREKRKQERARRRWFGGVTAVALILFVALLYALWSRQEALRQRAIAQERQLEAETARDRADKAASAEKVAKEEESRQREQAVRAQKDAEEQRDFARRQQQIAFARQLAAQADLLAEQQAHRFPLSVLLYVESLKRLPSQETAEKLDARVPLLPRCFASLQHSSAVNTLAFSTDGRRLATGSADGTLTVWEAPGGKQLLRLRRRDGWPIMSLAFDGQRKLLAMRASNYQARGEIVSVWDIADGREIMRTPVFFNHETPLAFTPDSHSVMIDARDRLRGLELSLWDVYKGEERAAMRLEPEVGSSKPHFSISADGSSVAGVEGKTVWIQSLRTKQPRSQIRTEAEVSLATFSSDGEFLVTVADGFARLWELARPDKNARFHDDSDAVLPPNPSKRIFVGQARTVAYEPNQDRIAALTDGVVRIWNLADNLEVQRVSRAAEITSFAFSPDGSYFATSSRDGIVALCDNPVNFTGARPPNIAVTQKSVFVLQGVGSTRAIVRDLRDRQIVNELQHMETIRALAISPDARMIAVGGDKSLVLWDSEKKLAIAKKEGTLFFGLAFDASGTKLAAASYHTVEIVDTRAGRPLVSLRYSEKGRDPDWGLPGDEAVTSISRKPTDAIEMAFGSDGTHLQINKNSDSGTQLWNLETQKKIWHARDGNTRLSADGRYLITKNGRQIIGHTVEGKLVFNSRLPKATQEFLLAASREDKIIAVSDGRSVDVRDTRTGNKLAELKLDWEDCVSMTAFALDSAGAHLAAVCHRRNNTAIVRIWGIPRFALVARLAHDKFVSRLTFSSDDRLMILETPEKPRSWYWRTEDLIREACLSVGRSLTPAEWKVYFGQDIYRKTCAE